MVPATKRQDKRNISYEGCSETHLLSDRLLRRGNIGACVCVCVCVCVCCRGLKYISTLAFCRLHKHASSNKFLFLFSGVTEVLYEVFFGGGDGGRQRIQSRNAANVITSVV